MSIKGRTILCMLALCLPVASAACSSGEVEQAAQELEGAASLDEGAPDADAEAEAQSGDAEAVQVSSESEEHAELAWFDGSVEEAFEFAAAEDKPLFLYWGAEWCPPCHYLKHAVFKRPEFVAKMESYVPVYLDGDSERAQIFGEQFDVQGYPTVIIFNAAAEEVMRMTSGVPADQYATVLDAAIGMGRPVQDVLEEVLELGPAAADPSDLSLLAYYAWGQDSLVQLADEDLMATFQQLYEETPDAQPVVRSRFFTEYMGEVISQASSAASDAEDEEIAVEDKAQPPLSIEGLAALQAPIETLLQDADQRRANMSFINYWSRETVELLYPEASVEREAFVESWLAGARAIEDDETLSVDDRLTASYPMLELTKLRRDDPFIDEGDASEEGDEEEGSGEVGEVDPDEPESDPAAETEEEGPAPLPDETLDRLRQQVGWAGEASADASELQAVMSSMIWLLQEADLDEEAEALLEARMDDTIAPYYYMGWMASIKRGDDKPEEALEWYRRASDNARGRYSRFRWGSIYLRRLIEYKTDSPELIETETLRILDELLQYDDAFALGNYSRLGQLESAIVDWNEEGAQEEIVQRIRDRVQASCERYEAIDAESQTGQTDEPAEEDAAESDEASEGEAEETEAEEAEDGQQQRCLDFLAAEEEDEVSE